MQVSERVASVVAFHCCKLNCVNMFSLVSTWNFHSTLVSIGWVLLATHINFSVQLFRIHFLIAFAPAKFQQFVC